ncbi:MAG: response regulator transcription factor [Polyangiales bacterium]
MTAERKDDVEILLVDDDPVLAGHLVRIVSREFTVRSAASVAGAREMIATFPRIQGAVLDFQLPDGCGLDIIDTLREAGLRIPTLLLTAHFDKDIALAAQDRGAEFAVKPTSLERLEAFLSAVRSAATDREHARQRDVAARIAARFSLSKQEANLLSLYASGTARSDLAEAMGVSENTVKTMVRRILWKCGYVGELRDVIDAWRDGDPKRNVS